MAGRCSARSQLAAGGSCDEEAGRRRGRGLRSRAKMPAPRRAIPIMAAMVVFRSEAGALGSWR